MHVKVVVLRGTRDILRWQPDANCVELLIAMSFDIQVYCFHNDKLHIFILHVARLRIGPRSMVCYGHHLRVLLRADIFNPSMVYFIPI